MWLSFDGFVRDFFAPFFFELFFFRLPRSMDLRAALPEDKPMRLAVGKTAMVPTGLSMALPQGFEAQIRPRSGLAAKFSVTVLNSPGTVDSDYRGEVKVILINHGLEAFEINRGDRIAQMVISPITQGILQETDALPDSERGEGGFGSTGGTSNGSQG